MIDNKNKKLMLQGYLYRDMFFLNKDDIHNIKKEELNPVTLFLNIFDLQNILKHTNSFNDDLDYNYETCFNCSSIMDDSCVCSYCGYTDLPIRDSF